MNIIREKSEEKEYLNSLLFVVVVVAFADFFSENLTLPCFFVICIRHIAQEKIKKNLGRTIRNTFEGYAKEKIVLLTTLTCLSVFEWC